MEKKAAVQEMSSSQPLSDKRAYAGADSDAPRRILYPAAGLSIAAALIHLWTMPEHFREWWAYGALLLLVALAQGTYGLALLRWPRRPLVLAGIAGNLSLVSFYIVTRTVGVPFFGPHAWHPEAVGAFDLAASTAEISVVAALVALARGFSAARVYATLGALQAFGVGSVLHLAHSGMQEAYGISPVSHWLTSSALAMPLSVLVLWLATPPARRIGAFCFVEKGIENFGSRLTWALVAAAAYAVASVPSSGFASQHAGMGSSTAQAILRDAGVVLGATFVLMLAAAAVRGAPWETPRAINLWRPRAASALAGAVAAVAVLAGPALFGFPPSGDAHAQSAACNADTFNRSYNVAAINVQIPFNRWGDINPYGQLFVLQGDKLAVKNWHMELGKNADGTLNPANDPAGAENRRLRPRPLVIRANAGECVKIDFTNELDATQGDGLPQNPRASMRIKGVSYNAQTSDGSMVGFNNDTTVGIGESITYFWQAPKEEGLHFFRDEATTATSEANSGSIAHGLYGALAVEPAGSEWRDPETGQPLYAGATDHNRITRESGDPYVDADIIPPGGEAFRESVQISQDEIPGRIGMGFNYGSEPQHNREGDNLVPDGVGEEVSLSSWGYGDPALIKLASGKGPWLPEKDAAGNLVTDTEKVENCGLQASCYVSNVHHAYPHDPTKIRFAHAGPKETHVFHLHANQWLSNPDDPESNTLDSQTYGPGESFTADLIGGAGSKPGTVGDSIFHCHLYPHFANGFWSLLRVHDVREDGSTRLPDGTRVRALQPLPDRAAPPAPTADNPGFPRFIPGEFGWRAPQSPNNIFEPGGANDDPATPLVREDLKPAERIVAGKPLDPDKLAVEEKVLARAEANGAGEPGAPLTDPCPSTARQVTYNVSVMQRDIVYNEAGWHDTQGRFLVLDKDVPKMLEKNPDGSYKHQPEPFFFRANAGDCINLNLTNMTPNWFGNDAFQELVQTNMMGQHIHYLKFDVLASDGSSNGWNYQQAAFTRDQMEFKNRILSGNLRTGENCDQKGCRLPNPDNWDPTTATTPDQVGQTITARWYADYELKTAFTHDHHFAAVDQNRGQFAALIIEPKGMDYRNPKTGEFFQPGNGSIAGAPNCGQACEGNAVGSAMDIIGPGTTDDFREFGLQFQDFASLTKAGGDPQNPADTINPPEAPQHFPDEDLGTMGINYRNAPFLVRQEKKPDADPAHIFSSWLFGDPRTPVLEAYSNDPVRIRLAQGAHEEQHVFNLQGMRWLKESADKNSPLVNTQSIGVSEAFSFRAPAVDCDTQQTMHCFADLLYGGTATDDLYLGKWGIMRVRGERGELLPLPDNPVQNVYKGDVVPQATGTPPPTANVAGNPCPPGAPNRRYDVVAMEANLEYNKYGDHDPFGLIYALAEDEAAIRDGTKKPEPLVLRANEGDCVEVSLTNKLTQSWLSGHGNAGTNGDPTLATEPGGGTPAGLRVSLHPQLVKYDPRFSNGATVGFGFDQTVAPGESTLYRWYADDVSPGEIGATNLTDFGDVRGHRHHGLFAGLNIEPAGATYHDPITGNQINSGASADIRVPGENNDFREFTTFFQDGLNLRDKTGAIIPDPPEADDPEDMGEKGFNYANAPFRHRLGTLFTAQDLAHVFSSRIHGDPDTPIFRAYRGDRIRMRLLQGSDKPRQHSFQLSGSNWKSQPNDPQSRLIGLQGGFSVAHTENVHLNDGTGGVSAAFIGDYRYGTGVLFEHLSGGLWGIMRVYTPTASTSPTPIGAEDDPYAGGHPIMPLEP